MSKKLAVLSIIALCLFMGGCDNIGNNTINDFQCENNNECNAKTDNNLLVEDNLSEENSVEIVQAEKLAGDEMITISEGDMNTEYVEATDNFETPIM